MTLRHVARSAHGSSGLLRRGTRGEAEQEAATHGRARIAFEEEPTRGERLERCELFRADLEERRGIGCGPHGGCAGELPLDRTRVAVLDADMEVSFSYMKLIRLVDPSGPRWVEHRLNGQEAPVGAGQLLARGRAEHRQAPACETEYRCLELLAEFGELVAAFTARGAASPQDAVLDQELEPVGEQVGADARQLRQKLAVPPWPEKKLPDDEQRPPLTEHVKGGGEAAVLTVVASRHISDTHLVAIC